VDASADSGADLPFLHPRASARLRVGDTDAGSVGELHPDVCEAFGLGGRAVCATLDVDRVLEAVAALGLQRAVALPRFPSVTRDIAVVVGQNVAAGAVAIAIREAGGQLVEGVELFDVYRGQGIGEGAKSLAFRVMYRDTEATLTDKRVDAAYRAAVGAVAARFGASLRE
jgi:phenylalanyl-tRNA synthetase beta chain